MPHRNIVYTKHAMQRRLERDISDDDIKKAIDEPNYVISSFEGRMIATKKINSRTIQVVYKEEVNKIIIITVY
mgnify:CR=1 FL=1